jgi:predicted enzyme related to lactoylglutathione lyase
MAAFAGLVDGDADERSRSAAVGRRRPAHRGRPQTPGGKDTGISLETDDIDTYHAQLKDHGVDVDAEVSRFGDAVPPLFWLRDPEGNKLMVVEAR